MGGAGVCAALLPFFYTVLFSSFFSFSSLNVIGIHEFWELLIPIDCEGAGIVGGGERGSRG